MGDRIRATYWIETAFPPQLAAEAMAGEQSSGTFVKLAGETEELKARHAARVEKLELLDSAPAPSLPGAAVPAQTAKAEWRRAEVELSWPLENLGLSLPNVLATVAGNLFELRQFSGLRLLDLQLPEAFLGAYPGPQFGICGTRKLVAVPQLPLVGTIIKPSVGLSPEGTAQIVRQLAAGGIDFVKDDELQADGPHCPFEQRLRSVMREINGHAERSGKKVMYAFNVTGEIDEMKRRHDLVASYGGNCIMVSIHSVGLPAFVALRRHSALPIHAHRNGWGVYSRSPAIGISYIAWQKLWRLAGADHRHVNGLSNKFCESDESVLASARECLTPMFDAPGRGCEVMPVFSSGQWAGQAFDTYSALGSADLIHAAGGGIMAHPGGIAAGVASIRQAWEAALSGQTLAQASGRYDALRQAMEKFAP